MIKEELDKDALASLDRGMAESAKGQVINRGSFAKYVKQGEIAAGMGRILVDNFENEHAEGENTRVATDELIAYLHSRGVVIKVDRELPQDGNWTELRKAMEAQVIALEAGYELTIPLVEE